MLKHLWIAIFVVVAFAAAMRAAMVLQYAKGWNDAKAEIPSCLYVLRPGTSPQPFGWDGKIGFDACCDRIDGGGYYVSLQRWETRK